MILIFWDKSRLVVTKKQWLEIKRMRDVEKLDWIVLKNPEAEFSVRTIAKVMPGGFTETDLPPQKVLAARGVISDEQRAANLVRLAQIKKDFATKVAQKHRSAPEERNDAEKSTPLPK